MGKKNDDPHQRLEALERWSGRATLVIFAGIVLEVFSLFFAPHTAWDRMAGAIANFLIGMGLIIEYVVIGRAIVATGEANRLSDEKVAEANKIAAQATKDAAEARERTAEVERLTAWRRVDDNFRQNLTNAFSGMSALIELAIEYQSSSDEAFSYAAEIAALFHSLGNERILFRPNSHVMMTVFGVEVRVGDVPHSPELCKLCKKAFEIDLIPQDMNKIFGNINPIPNLYIFVGLRPPPIFDKSSLTQAMDSST